MGYDIEIVLIKYIDSLSLSRSYNWCGFSYYFDIVDHLMGRNEKMQQKNIISALDKFKAEGITVGAPDDNNINWGWGLIYNKNKYNEKIRKGIYKDENLLVL